MRIYTTPRLFPLPRRRGLINRRKAGRVKANKWTPADKLQKGQLDPSDA